MERRGVSEGGVGGGGETGLKESGNRKQWQHEGATRAHPDN